MIGALLALPCADVARDFYRQFYQADLTEAERDKLLEGAQARR